MVWAMLYPEMEVLFLMVIPVPIKWLAIGIISVDLLINLSNGSFVAFASHLTAPLVGYLYALIAWELRGPFEFTAAFDTYCNGLGQSYRSKASQEQEMQDRTYNQAKIFDFRTGEAVVEDDEFVDLMLNKISMYGEDSLNKKERRRLDQISEAKRTAKK
jgi:hypothetical protein